MIRNFSQASHKDQILQTKERRRIAGLCLKMLTLAISLVPAVASAQSISPISTDRPTFSDGTGLVATGHLQFETGTTANTVAGRTTFTYGEILARYGYSNRVEFRIANVTWTHVAGQSDGFQDPSLGAKFWIQTGSKWRPDLSAELMTSVPAGSSQLRVNRSQPTVKLIWNQQINSTTTITGNLIVSDLGPLDARFTQWAQSAFLTRTINAKLSLFAEAFRLEPTSYAGPQGTYYDIGATYLLSNNLQLDARYGAGFDQDRDGHLIGFGISYRY